VLRFMIAGTISRISSTPPPPHRPHKNAGTSHFQKLPFILVQSSRIVILERSFSPAKVHRAFEHLFTRSREFKAERSRNDGASTCFRSRRRSDGIGPAVCNAPLSCPSRRAGRVSFPVRHMAEQNADRIFQRLPDWPNSHLSEIDHAGEMPLTISSGERAAIEGNLAKSDLLKVSRCITPYRSIAATSRVS